jgi:hypothetical protein
MRSLRYQSLCRAHESRADGERLRREEDAVRFKELLARETGPLPLSGAGKENAGSAGQSRRRLSEMMFDHSHATKVQHQPAKDGRGGRGRVGGSALHHDSAA